MACTQKKDAVLDPVIAEFLTASGLVEADAFNATPLTGGVASDIWKIITPTSSFVVKKALARLRVSQEWNAPVSRNASEVEWLLVAGKAVSHSAPHILAHDPDKGVFAMDYLEPATNPVWKAELLRGRVDIQFASKLGEILSTIHSSTANRTEVSRRFANDEVFHSIRLEPYIEAIAHKHGDLSGQLFELSRQTLNTRKALVHGDVSPKNILMGANGPVLLDAECAWYGDPAFDLAFCLNHLLLKAVWNPASAKDYALSFAALTQRYLEGVDWEDRTIVEARAALLLPALSLARVDGKSPVEYLTKETDIEFVRRNSRLLIKQRGASLSHIKHYWLTELSKHD
ncbi:phosphotransferase [Brucella haematophila]|uniref:phosphotransferase n=1 Tax=Brucella haematophila TaxID=419474 RepID=UPI00110E3D16|nr:phosphotransferase [Brucella haematophila]TMU95484.1 aminoglycoside phosphotransferase family protein [Brucella haematophila]